MCACARVRVSPFFYSANHPWLIFFPSSCLIQCFSLCLSSLSFSLPHTRARTHTHAQTHTRTHTSCGLESILCFLVSSERPSRALGARPSNEPPAAQRSSCHRGETTSHPSHVISAGTRARAAASLKGFSAAEREIPVSHGEHPSLNRC